MEKNTIKFENNYENIIYESTKEVYIYSESQSDKLNYPIKLRITNK